MGNQEKINNFKLIEQNYKSSIVEIESLEASEQVIFDSHKLVVNLLDPISFTQMDLPGRGVNCKHKDNFDVSRFILLNFSCEYGSKWKCPICAKPTFKDDLLIDLVCQNILNDLRKQHPTIYNLIDKVFMKNQNLEYDIDFSKIKKEEVNCSFKKILLEEYFSRRISNDLGWKNEEAI